MEALIGSLSEAHFFLILTTITCVVFLLVLWIIIRLETKMKRIENKLDAIGENATHMVKMGLKYFEGKS